MKPMPLLSLGIKRWQDSRPTDPVARICGGDFTAFAASPCFLYTESPTQFSQ